MSLFGINNQELGRKASAVVKKNLYQGLLHKDDRGVTAKYAKPSDADSALVDIYVPQPLKGKLRMYGGAVNGLWVNQNNLPDSNGQGRHVLSKRFTVDMLKRYDEIVEVSEEEIQGTSSTEINESFVSIAQTQITNDITLNTNAYVFAEQINEFFQDSFSATPTATEVNNALEIYVKPNPDNGIASRTAFARANAKISRGSKVIYASFIPADQRQAFIMDEASFGVDLTIVNHFQASDISAMMAGRGGVNPFSGQKKTEADYKTGWFGMLNGVPLYVVAQDIKDKIWENLGLDATKTADLEVIELLEQIVCFITPAASTSRTMKLENIKSVDNPKGQGIILQPLAKLGCRTFDGKLIKAVASGADFADTATAIASITKIKDAIKMQLPNMSYDLNPPIAANSVLTTVDDGTQSITVTLRNMQAQFAEMLTKFEALQRKEAKEEVLAKVKERTKGAKLDNKAIEQAVEQAVNGIGGQFGNATKTVEDAISEVIDTVGKDNK